MIGSMQLPNGAEAVLEDNGTWACPDDPAIEKLLNLTYNPHNEHLHSQVATLLPLGVFTLERAARELGGKITQEPKIEPLPAGAIM